MLVKLERRADVAEPIYAQGVSRVTVMSNSGWSTRTLLRNSEYTDSCPRLQLNRLTNSFVVNLILSSTRLHRSRFCRTDPLCRLRLRMTQRSH
jgi:hypothetical protein